MVISNSCFAAQACEAINENAAINHQASPLMTLPAAFPVLWRDTRCQCEFRCAFKCEYNGWSTRWLMIDPLFDVVVRSAGETPAPALAWKGWNPSREFLFPISPAFSGIPPCTL